MNTVTRVVAGLLAGVVGFAVAAVAVTAGFEPRVEFSLLIGLPVGLYAGLTALFATYVGLWYRDRDGDGSASRSAARRLRAAVAAVAAFVLVAAVGVAVFFLASASAGIALLVVGLPVTLVVAAIAGYLLAGRSGGDADDARSSSR